MSYSAEELDARIQRVTVENGSLQWKSITKIRILLLQAGSLVGGLMSNTYQTFLVLKLHRRVLQWDKFSQIELSVLVDLLREHGTFAVLGNPACAVEGCDYDPSGDIKRIDFWIKIRGDYVFLSLEVRSPDVLVLHDTKW